MVLRPKGRRPHNQGESRREFLPVLNLNPQPSGKRRLWHPQKKVKSLTCKAPSFIRVNVS